MADELVTAEADRLRHEIADLRQALARTQYTLRTLIHWTVASANSPLSRREAERLLDIEAGREPMQG